MNEIAAFAIIGKTGPKTRYIYQILTVPEWHRNDYAGALLRVNMEIVPAGTMFALWVENSN